MPPRRPTPTGGSWPVDAGTAELVRDLDRPNGWLLLVDGTPQSYLDLDDPGHLEFEYVRLLADLVDGVGEPGEPLAVVHLGGGACTLPRYVAHTRPRSRQVVVESDAALVAVVRRQLGTDGFRLRVGDGREALRHLAAGSGDVVLVDVFTGSRLPAHLTTLEYVQEAKAVLRTAGLYAVNVADGGQLAFARQQAATLAAVFTHVVVLADPGVFRGRRFGNLVIGASDAPLAVDRLRQVTARSVGRARVEGGAAFARGARPATDAAPPRVPAPPPDLFAAP